MTPQECADRVNEHLQAYYAARRAALSGEGHLGRQVAKDLEFDRHPRWTPRNFHRASRGRQYLDALVRYPSGVINKKLYLAIVRALELRDVPEEFIEAYVTRCATRGADASREGLLAAWKREKRERR